MTSVALKAAQRSRDKARDPDAQVRSRIQWVWALLFLNIMSYSKMPLVIPIPSVMGKGLTQGSLWAAFALALTINRKVRVRPNVYLITCTLLAILSAAVSLAVLKPGTDYRAVRLIGFLCVLWLLTPWFGRRDMLLLKCHLRCVVTVCTVSLIGLCLGPNKAMQEGRLNGDIWPIPPTQLAHYAAIAGGIGAVMWFAGLIRRNQALGLIFLSVTVIMLSHTRTALVAMLVGVLVGGLSLFVRSKRVRKTFMIAVVVAALGGLLLMPVASHWFMRGESGSSFTDLSGRTLVWHRLLTEPRSESEILFGQGLSNKSFDGLPIDDSWLAAYQDQGLVGDFLIGFYLLALLIAAFNARAGPRRAIAFAILVYCGIASYTEVGLGDASSYLLDLTVVASLLAAPIWARRTSSFTLMGPPSRYQGSGLRRWTVPITGYARTHAIRIGYRLGMSPDSAARVAVTMFDQCFASGSNFVVGVAVARIAGPAGLGAFTLAYGCWILLNLMHRSLITDPMAIFRDMNSGKAASAVRRGFAAEVILGLAATAVFVVLGVGLRLCGLEAFGNGVLAVAPWIVFLDIQDFWRWIGFMQGKPGKSLANDVFFTVIQGVAFGVVFIVGMHSVFAVVAAWGVGALAGSAYGLVQFSVRPAIRGGFGLLRSRWNLSKWNAGSQMVGWGQSQLYLLLTGALLGPAALGGLKAAQNLVTGPSAVVIHAGGSFGLPEASRGLAERGWRGLRRIARIINGTGALSVAAFGAIVLLVPGTLLRMFYGASFVKYAEASRLTVLAFIISAFWPGPILILKVTKRTRPLMHVQVIALVSSVAAVIVCARLWGVNGAAFAGVVSNVFGLVALWIFQRAAHRSIEAPAPPPQAVEALETGDGVVEEVDDAVDHAALNLREGEPVGALNGAAGYASVDLSTGASGDRKNGAGVNLRNGTNGTNGTNGAHGNGRNGTGFKLRDEAGDVTIAEPSVTVAEGR